MSTGWRGRVGGPWVTSSPVRSNRPLLKSVQKCWWFSKSICWNSVPMWYRQEVVFLIFLFIFICVWVCRWCGADPWNPHGGWKRESAPPKLLSDPRRHGAAPVFSISSYRYTQIINLKMGLLFSGFQCHKAVPTIMLSNFRTFHQHQEKPCAMNNPSPALPCLSSWNHELVSSF